MALIKCSECGKEISDKAITCPSCGIPVQAIPINEHVEVRQTKRSNGFLIFLLIILAISILLLLYETSTNLNLKNKLFSILNQIPFLNIETSLKNITPSIPKNVTAPKDKSKEITLQKVDNVGYTFYIGRVDYPNAPAIGDDIKTEITKAVYNARFPKSLLKNIPIIFLNSLAITSGQYIATPTGDVPLINRGPSLLSEGGLYSAYSSGGKAVIYINSSVFDNNKSDNAIINAFATESNKGKITEILTHELGHAIDSTLTDKDWEKYYQLRNIPTDTPRQSQTWNMSPREDFAEVYKNIFTGLDVRTNYGILVPSYGNMEMGQCFKVYLSLQDSYTPKTKIDNNDSTAWLKSITNPLKIDYTAIQAKISIDPQMQNCRKEVMAHPEKYPNDFQYGTPYKSSVDQKTKDFINEIMNRFN